MKHNENEAERNTGSDEIENEEARKHILQTLSRYSTLPLKKRKIPQVTATRPKKQGNIVTEKQKIFSVGLRDCDNKVWICLTFSTANVCSPDQSRGEAHNTMAADIFSCKRRIHKQRRDETLSSQPFADPSAEQNAETNSFSGPPAICKDNY